MTTESASCAMTSAMSSLVDVNHIWSAASAVISPFVADLQLIAKREDAPLVAIVVTCIIAVISIVIYQCCQRLGMKPEKIGSKVKAVKEFVAPGEGPRFRKRDRIAFLSRRAIRNAKAVGTYIRGGQGKKRRDMAKLVKRVWQRGSPNSSMSRELRPGLPEEYLEEDGVMEAGVTDAVPEALVIVLKNLRVFGHFENTILLELMKNIEYVTVRQNEYLFRVGDPDCSMFIVESGSLSVCYEGSEREEKIKLELKQVNAGEPIVSLCSFLDYLSGKRNLYKTVSARAVQDTRIIKFSFECFKNAFKTYPDNLAQVVQVVMVRLQRVTLLALHQYLGLGAELLTQQPRGNVHSNRKHHASSGAAAPATRGEVAPGGNLASPDKSKPGPDQAHQHLQQPEQSQHKDLSPQSSSMEEPAFVQTVFPTKKKLSHMGEEQLRKLSIDGFKTFLGLSEEDLIEDAVSAEQLRDVEIVTYNEGDVLTEEDTSSDNNLFLVLTGCVTVSQRDVEDVPREMHRAYQGGLLGQLQVLTCEPSFFTYTAVQGARCAVLSEINVRRIMGRHPHVALSLAMSVVSNLSPHVRSIDFALEWMLVESGKALYKQDTKADSTYVVLSGRLRSVITRSSKRELVCEYGRGELTGIVETLMKTPRSTTVIAVRDTEVAKLPAGLIDFIKMKFPQVLMRLIKLLGEKLQRSWEKGSDPRSLAMSQPASSGLQPLGSAQANFSTVAVVPQSPDVPYSAFTLELIRALNVIDPSMRVTRDYVLDELGPDAFNKSSDFRLSAWLAQQEDKHRIVIYQCDRELTQWTKLCIRHADVIFILADPTMPHIVTPAEESLEAYSMRTRKEMIFLHREDTKYPKGTSLWLRNRNWISAHYHIKCPNRMFFKKTQAKVEHMYARFLSQPPDIHADFSRLARMVTGSAVGLVLGGGGARGCSHVGMIKAILEAGIPIDAVGGVSIGAFIGGLWCKERDITELTVKARSFSYKMVQKWRFIVDITYPHTSYFSGVSFNTLLKEVFSDEIDIRDFWLPYFTVTTDITDSSMRIHDYGTAWRYIRASMSLAGYMPPLCDPHDGHLLLDGGYVNNLPADIMRMRGARHIMAVDVGAQDDIEFSNYGDSLSGFQVFLSRWLPWRREINVPNQADVQTRLAYVSCAGKLETVKAADYCDYIRPPIDRYGTLQFGNFDEIKDVGYYHGQTYFSGLVKAGLMKPFLVRQNSGPEAKPKAPYFILPNAIRRGSMDNVSSSLESHQSCDFRLQSAVASSNPESNSASFSNLAEMVCSPFKTPNVNAMESEDDDVDDEEGGEYLTEEDSDNLISDEEDDAESGFLSQF